MDNAKSIFLAAIEMPPAERADFLNEAMAGDAALRERVEALLSAHDDPESFLEKPAAHFGAAVDLSGSELPIAERLGTLIGPYKLLEQIGEGGMGVVYMAEQQTPVRRRVALKIIKPGMDTRQVIARFEAERQALALMDHPNIARVLDAGATDSGRPYFVMELVRGIPITEYCDQNNLPVHERLELFVQVCQAVQHAHQKGIIHRDLKPSNVLVTLTRRPTGAQGDRFRRGQGDQPAAHREDAVHRLRPNGRHAAVHEPRAGGDDQPRHRHAHRTSIRWACCFTSC